MKMLCTSSRLRCGFELFGRKKRISYFSINSFTILFLIHSKNTHEVFAEVFLIKTISNPIMLIKFGKVIPIRDSSLIPLPAKIAKSDQSINIRGHSDHNCYLLFYTAAYHLTYKLGLFLGGRLTLNWKRLIHIPIRSPERINHQAISLCL